MALQKISLFWIVRKDLHIWLKKREEGDQGLVMDLVVHTYPKLDFWVSEISWKWIKGVSSTGLFFIFCQMFGIFDHFSKFPMLQFEKSPKNWQKVYVQFSSKLFLPKPGFAFSRSITKTQDHTLDYQNKNEFNFGIVQWINALSLVKWGPRWALPKNLIWLCPF